MLWVRVMCFAHKLSIAPVWKFCMLIYNTYVKLKTLFQWYLIIIGVWLLRVALTGTLRTGYLLWNVFLAFVPYMLIAFYTKYTSHLHGWTREICKLVTGLLCLLFLPNSFYILTDFLHLNSAVLVNDRNDVAYRGMQYARGDGLYVFDSLLLFMATVLGAYAGATALLVVYRSIRRRYSKPGTIIALLAVMLLSASGVYIGRFGRWNSWDAIIKPWLVIGDLRDMLSTASSVRRFLLVTTSIFVLEIVSMVAVVRLGAKKNLYIK